MNRQADDPTSHPIPTRKFHPLPGKSRAGFTLVELLVVISIMGVLASLSATAYSRVRRNAERVITTNNLHQLSVAILSFAADHDNYLPGPLTGGQLPRYTSGSSEQLAYQLWPYLGTPAPSKTEQISKILTNPGYLRYRQSPLSPSYILNHDIPKVGGGTYSPWGYDHPAPAADEPTMTLSQITIQGVGTNWAMQDVDQKNCGPSTGWYSYLPKEPVHGSVRMQLYFDWHVEAKPVK